MRVSHRRLRELLDSFYAGYDFQGRIARDPIEFPRRYDRPEDAEVAGFIASSFAYGKVELFKPVVASILSVMGESPYDFLCSFRPSSQRRLFAGLRYRFNRTEDIVCLLYVTGRALRENGSLEHIFKSQYREDSKDISIGMTGLIETLEACDTTPVYGRNVMTPGFLQFFSLPAKGSSCKRMNLFLRWMIRDRDIDLGLWKDIPKSRLVMPLDTHIARISRCLGLTKRNSQDWNMAVEITESLKRFDPEDPLKYDFALCHQGIAGICSEANCGDCRVFNRSGSLFRRGERVWKTNGSRRRSGSVSLSRQPSCR
jgi:uncharacterized protein (TIGR02757 family)